MSADSYIMTNNEVFFNSFSLKKQTFVRFLADERDYLIISEEKVDNFTCLNDHYLLTIFFLSGNQLD